MKRSIVLLFAVALCFSATVYAQGTAADYERASGLKAKYEAAAIDIAGAPTWIGNTQWMGWPIGPQYSASSNVDNAYRLQGDLLLVVAAPVGHESAGVDHGCYCDESVVALSLLCYDEQ